MQKQNPPRPQLISVPLYRKRAGANEFGICFFCPQWKVDVMILGSDGTANRNQHDDKADNAEDCVEATTVDSHFVLVPRASNVKNR